MDRWIVTFVMVALLAAACGGVSAVVGYNAVALWFVGAAIASVFAELVLILVDVWLLS